MTTAPSVQTSPEARRRWLSDLGWHVQEKVAALQRQYLANVSTAAAALAQLRRGLGRQPGDVPELWPIVQDGLPLPAKYGDEPTRNEFAAYAALTLYAVHQQSQRRGMHQPGQGLGAAVRVLSTKAGSEAAVRRRFEALGTATDFAEVVHHARGLISQLCTHTIALDYGRLADDLVRLQWPDSAAKVRLAWGRDFYQAARASNQTDQDDNQSSNGAAAADVAGGEEG